MQPTKSALAALLLNLAATATPGAAQETFVIPASLPIQACAQALVHVTAASAGEHELACSAAEDALRLLGRCNITVRRPLQIHIVSKVRHPLGGEIFGLFDPKTEKVLVTQYANIPALVTGTPYAELPQSAFYKSLVVHEIVHGILHQNYQRKPSSRAAYEYPAYALQIASLPSSERDKFLLSSIDSRARGGNFLFSDSILLFDPFFFAARAYEHFSASTNACGHLQALLQGEVVFIATLP